MELIYVTRKQIRLCICLVIVPLLSMFYLLSEHSSHLQEFKLLFSPEILLHNIPLTVQTQLNTSENTLMKFVGVIMLGSGDVSYSRGHTGKKVFKEYN